MYNKHEIVTRIRRKINLKVSNQVTLCTKNIRFCVQDTGKTQKVIAIRGVSPYSCINMQV